MTFVVSVESQRGMKLMSAAGAKIGYHTTEHISVTTVVRKLPTNIYIFVPAAENGTVKSVKKTTG